MKGHRCKRAGFASAFTVSLVLTIVALPSVALASAGASPDERSRACQPACELRSPDCPGGSARKPVPTPPAWNHTTDREAGRPVPGHREVATEAEPEMSREKPQSGTAPSNPQREQDVFLQPDRTGGDRSGPKVLPAPTRAEDSAPAAKAPAAPAAKSQPVTEAPAPTTVATVPAAGDAVAEPATAASVVGEEPIIGLIPPISVVRPQPGLREAVPPVAVNPAAAAPTIVEVLGVQVVRQSLPATGVDVMMVVTGFAFLSWVGRHTSDRL